MFEDDRLPMLASIIDTGNSTTSTLSGGATWTGTSIDTTGYSPMRAQLTLYGIHNDTSLEPKYPLGPFPALTDIGWMAKSATTSQVSVNF